MGQGLYMGSDKLKRMTALSLQLKTARLPLVLLALPKRLLH